MTVRALEKRVMDLPMSEIERRVSEIKCGKVKGIPAAETSLKARRALKAIRKGLSRRRQ